MTFEPFCKTLPRKSAQLAGHGVDIRNRSCSDIGGIFAPAGGLASAPKYLSIPRNDADQ
jgi:hypothetical protein